MYIDGPVKVSVGKFFLQMRTRNFELQKQHCFLQGVLSGIFPVTLLFFRFTPPLLSGAWAAAVIALLPLLAGSGAALLFRFPAAGRVLITAVMGLAIFLLFPVLCTDPLLALFTGVTVIGSLYYLFSARIVPLSSSAYQLRWEHFRGTALALTTMTMFSPLFVSDYKLFSIVCLADILLLLRSFGGIWNTRRGSRGYQWWKTLLLLGCAAGAIALSLNESIVFPAFLLGAAGYCFSLIRRQDDLKYLSVIIEHPGRSVFLTFGVLSAAGTLLLRTPVAMTGEIEVINAAFTAVSGVCVTGLSTIDISRDLTFSGRCFLLLLIQTGGLGIMSLAALVLHALGRLSINQEQLLAELTPTQEQDIFQSLKQIFKVTVICEVTGALLLSCGFFYLFNSWEKALELGIFTSVSAFCNAGFFPGADNMIPYAGNPFILLVTALLITAGGIAPAVIVSLCRVCKGEEKMPAVSKLVAGTTLLLLSGTAFFLLLFEWDGIFGALSIPDKIVNSFFLAASLRTAGFSSLVLENCGVPAVIVMMLCMFTGGSPGGTAGGIKVTTLALLVLTLRAAARGEDEVVFDGHRIPGKNIIQAVAIVCSAVLVLLTVIIMLVTTQTITSEKVIFESISALGTVGLSLGGTRELDAIGKVIIMAAMFIGRIGPLTLFLLLSDGHGAKNSGLPPVSIPLG